MCSYPDADFHADLDPDTDTLNRGLVQIRAVLKLTVVCMQLSKYIMSSVASP